MRITTKTVLGVAAALLLFFGTAQADPTFVGYPAPGGNSAAGSGISPGHAGGKTWEFSGFDPNAYGDLYYAAGTYDSGGWQPLGPQIWTNLYPTSKQLTYDAGASDLAGGEVVWTGSIRMDHFVPSHSHWHYNEGFSARFTLSITDTSNNALALTAANTLSGVDDSVGGVLDVQGDFKANLLFEVYNNNSTYPMPVGWTAANAFFDAARNAPGDRMNTSVGGGFYATAPTAPIPEPGSLALLGLGGLGLLWVRRRRNSA